MTQSVHNFSSKDQEAFKTLFLHKLRHDLVNTARPLIEIPKWIEEDIQNDGLNVPASMQENLDMLGNYGTRLLCMISDLLTYAHIGQHPETEPAPLSEILSATASDILPDGFQLITDLEHNQIGILKSDTATLLQAVLSNAVKHHDRETGKIRVTCKKIGQATQLTVSDDGPGIELKYIDQIFDPLTTLASRDQIEGSGMGLALVRRIAEINGATAKALSSVGKRGTCIVVWFP